MQDAPPLCLGPLLEDSISCQIDVEDSPATARLDAAAARAEQQRLALLAASAPSPSSPLPPNGWPTGRSGGFIDADMPLPRWVPPARSARSSQLSPSDCESEGPLPGSDLLVSIWGADDSSADAAVPAETDADTAAALRARCAELESEGFELRERLVEQEAAEQQRSLLLEDQCSRCWQEAVSLRDQVAQMEARAEQDRESQRAEIDRFRSELASATAAAAAAKAASRCLAGAVEASAPSCVESPVAQQPAAALGPTPLSLVIPAPSSPPSTLLRQLPALAPSVAEDPVDSGDTPLSLTPTTTCDESDSICGSMRSPLPCNPVAAPAAAPPSSAAGAWMWPDTAADIAAWAAPRHRAADAKPPLPPSDVKKQVHSDVHKRYDPDAESHDEPNEPDELQVKGSCHAEVDTDKELEWTDAEADAEPEEADEERPEDYDDDEEPFVDDYGEEQDEDVLSTVDEEEDEEIELETELEEAAAGVYSDAAGFYSEMSEPDASPSRRAQLAHRRQRLAQAATRRPVASEFETDDLPEEEEDEEAWEDDISDEMDEDEIYSQGEDIYEMPDETEGHEKRKVSFSGEKGTTNSARADNAWMQISSTPTPRSYSAPENLHQSQPVLSRRIPATDAGGDDLAAIAKCSSAGARALSGPITPPTPSNPGRSSCLSPSTPSPLPSSRYSAPFAENELGPQPLSTRGGQARIDQCPHGHQLQPYVNQVAGSCNHCDRCGRRRIAPPEQIYRCAECDYDVCAACCRPSPSPSPSCLNQAPTVLPAPSQGRPIGALQAAPGSAPCRAAPLSGHVIAPFPVPATTSGYPQTLPMASVLAATGANPNEAPAQAVHNNIVRMRVQGAVATPVKQRPEDVVRPYPYANDASMLIRGPTASFGDTALTPAGGLPRRAYAQPVAAAAAARPSMTRPPG